MYVDKINAKEKRRTGNPETLVTLGTPDKHAKGLGV